MAIAAAQEFVWTGSDNKGKKGTGEISATSLMEAKNLLRRRGISATRVKKKAKPLFGRAEKNLG